MAFLSQNPDLSVGQLHEQFGRPRGYVRGSLVKAMDRLLKKGAVERQMVDGTYRYRTVQGREELDRQLIDSFVKERLGGKLGSLAAYLTGPDGVDPAELQALREILSEHKPQ